MLDMNSKSFIYVLLLMLGILEYYFSYLVDKQCKCFRGYFDFIVNISFS